MNDYKKIHGIKPALPTVAGTQLGVTLTATITTGSDVNVKDWFGEDKLITVGVVPATVLVVIIVLVICCWYCCKKERKQPKGKAHAKSVTLQDFRLPRLRKSPVQPHSRRQREIKNLGRLEFSLTYDYERSVLKVKIIRGEELPLISASNVSFTYVVVELRPFSQKYEAKAQTRYIRNSFSPVFNDTINYQIPAKDLNGQTLYLFAYDINHLSAHDLIGCIKLKIDGKNLTSGFERFYKENLKWEEEISRTNGDILVGLCWRDKNEILEVSIQEASSLRIMDHDKLTSSPYVKIQVFVNSFLVLKKRTKVEKKTLSPKFRKTFNVTVPSQCLAHNTQIVLTMKHVAKFRRKHVIGQLYFGNEGKDTVCEHWKAMRKRGEYVEMWHQLDSSIDKSLLQSGSKIDYLLFGDDSDDETCAELSDTRSTYDGSCFEDSRSL